MRPFLGVEYDGDTIVRVVVDSPASRAGLLPGDRIIAVEGMARADDALPLLYDVFAFSPGDTVSLTIDRE